MKILKLSTGEQVIVSELKTNADGSFLLVEPMKLLIQNTGKGLALMSDLFMASDSETESLPSGFVMCISDSISPQVKQLYKQFADGRKRDRTGGIILNDSASEKLSKLEIVR